jgi:tripartite-type tricarboxylate transporter receptor subunit TctC
MKTFLLRLKTSKLWPLTFWALVVSCLIGNSLAQTYPNKPIKVINPWTAGGPADIVARPILNKLSERLGQAVVMENKAGANGVIGSAYVAKSAPDGYTLLFSHVGPIAISPSMQKDMPYNSITDFEPITQVVSAPTVLLVRSDFPAKNFEELIAIIKSKPGKLSYGSVGLGSTTHLAGEMLHLLGGLELLHIPYKGAAPVITDLLGGQIDMAFINISGAISYIESGKLKGLAVTTLKRSTLLPNLPTVAETYPGFEVNSWYGFMAPANTPKAIITRLQQELAAILKMPDIVQALKAGGLDPEGSTPEQYTIKIKDDLARWSAVVKSTGLTASQ